MNSISRRGRLAAAVVLMTLAAASSAYAQSRGGGRRGGSQTPSTPSSTPATPAVSTPPREYGPSLPGGALLCSSKDELIKYQSQTGVAADGAAPPDCRTILKPTEVSIVSRDGPSRTEVVTLDDTKLSGWTNTFFPPS